MPEKGSSEGGSATLSGPDYRRLFEDAERERRALEGELERLAYSISHDLRAPLRAIDGFSRMLEEDYQARLDDEGRRILRVVRDSSRRMGELIDGILAFSRLGRTALATAEIDMRRLVEEAIGDCAGAGARPRLVLGALPGARGDAVLLRQVWLNLLSNAVKFTGRREQPVIEVSGVENGVETIYTVRDNGAGFDPAYASKLFGVFQRLHPESEFPGTGMGLALVQRAVARHGGRVWAEGSPNAGAAFHFALPRGGK